MIKKYQSILEDVRSLFLQPGSGANLRPIHLEKDPGLPAWLSSDQLAWIEANGIEPKPGKHAVLPGTDADLAAVSWLDPDRPAPLHPGTLASALPPGDYRIAGSLDDPALAPVAWGLGHYAFTAYKPATSPKRRRLSWPDGADLDAAANIVAATWLARDLINTPANDLGPDELEAAIRDVAAHFGADCSSITGDDLVAANFPLIHAVGRASLRLPRLIDLTWGDPGAPKVTVVGKGICFDTGGLNLKPGPYMELMKKDMGGSAAALALAAMTMGAQLPVRLRLLIAAADNSVSGNSFRPGDILRSRAGLTVEIGDTDAEGRLVLADALALADEETPEHIFTFATLTGSARVALGPELPPVYSTSDRIADRLGDLGRKTGDPVWQMPFWQPYDKLIDSRIADVRNIAKGPFAGSIIAALFLKRFVKAAENYTHFDLYGWVPETRPGKPAGGDPQCARSVFAFLQEAYQKP